jgi:O-antigen/teichoic acid export membrane protein
LNKVLKKLASETAIYGVSHSLSRFLNFLLIIPLSKYFEVSEYGNISVYYSIVGFAMVLLMYGMETAFFNFSRSDSPTKVFSTGQLSILVSTFVFILLAMALQQPVANFLEYPDQTGFVRLFVFILALDALSTLPFAWLRYTGQAKRFGTYKLLSVGINVGLVLVFLIWFPKLTAKGVKVPFYNPDYRIGYVFVANFMASLFTFLITLPQWKLMREGFDSALWKKMFAYAKPLILVGLAGIVNETIDRIMLKKILASNVADYQIGVYSAFYKLSIIMTLFIQSFRMAAEPFFFDQSKNEEAPIIYAKVMHYFVIVTSFIFLITAVFADPIAHLFIRRSEYFDHPDWQKLVPILLLANLFLGLMYNLNIWYKLNNKNKIGRNIAIFGALTTIVLNFTLIPFIGILGSAITTLIVYLSMAVVSYKFGQDHYPIPYKIKLIVFYITTSLVLYLVWLGLQALLPSAQLLLSLAVVVLFAAVVYLVERPTKKV